MRGHRRSRRAFSMIEAVVSMAIVSTMLVAAINVAGSSALGRRRASIKVDAQHLAGQLMGEIQAKPLRASGAVVVPVVGADRAAFADIESFDGYAQAPPATMSGKPLAGAGWRWSVRVEGVSPAAPGGAAIAPSGASCVRITVIVSYADAEACRLVALRTRRENG